MLDPREIPRARKRLAFDYFSGTSCAPASSNSRCRQRDGDYSVADAVLSALAMFSLKDPSLLAFQTAATIRT